MDARQALVDAAEGFLQQTRSGGDLAGPREALARAIRHATIERLASRALGALAEDLAQATTIRVLAAFERGCTTAERLPAYVAEAARNAFASHRRKASTRREEATDLAMVEVPSDPAPSPEERFAAAQTTQDLAGRVRDLLGTMPEAYREVITRHYLDEVPIHDLVETEITARLAHEGCAADDPLARDALRRKARSTVDQRLCRARAWLEQRLVARDETEGPT